MEHGNENGPETASIYTAPALFYGELAHFGRASDLHSEGDRFEPDILQLFRKGCKISV